MIVQSKLWRGMLRSVEEVWEEEYNNCILNPANHVEVVDLKMCIC